MVLSLGVFSIGCGGADDTPAPSTETPAAGSGDGGEEHADHEGHEEGDEAPKDDEKPTEEKKAE